MARKKKTEEPKKLSPGSYWEYRCTIEEVKSARLNQKRTHLEQEIMNKEIENRKLKLALYRETIISASKSVKTAEAELEKIKKRLEEELKMSLENCAIDPYTFEVKSLDEPKI